MLSQHKETKKQQQKKKNIHQKTFISFCEQIFSLFCGLIKINLNSHSSRKLLQPAFIKLDSEFNWATLHIYFFFLLHFVWSLCVIITQKVVYKWYQTFAGGVGFEVFCPNSTRRRKSWKSGTRLKAMLVWYQFYTEPNNNILVLLGVQYKERKVCDKEERWVQRTSWTTFMNGPSHKNISLINQF